MIARFYLTLASISFVATAWGMDRHEDLFFIKHSKPMMAPIHVQRTFGSPMPYSHSAPAAPSYVPETPKTPKAKKLGSPKRSQSASEIPQYVQEQEDAAKLKAEMDAQAALKALDQARVALDNCVPLVRKAVNLALAQLKKDEQKS